MPLIKVTKRDGAESYIRLEKDEIQAMDVNSDDEGKYTRITCGLYHWFDVKETPEEILDLLDPPTPPIELGDPLA